MTIATDRALSDLLAGLDPSRTMEAMGKDPDPWQRAVLRSRRRRRAILASRQSGKSECAVAEALNVFARKDDARIVVAAPTGRQSAMLGRRVRRALPLGCPGIVATNNAATTLTTSNGGELVSVPGSRPDLIRGDGGLDLLIVDEAAFVTEDLFTVTLPMLLASDGDLLMMSTPGGMTGLMFDVMTADEGSPLADEWERFRVPASMIPRFRPEALAALRVSMGERAYDIEMNLNWREDGAAVFTSSEVDRFLGLDRIPEQLPGEPALPDEDDYEARPRLTFRPLGSR